MRCPGCGLENPQGTRFCIECGAGFSQRCPACGTDNLPRARFCGECGAPLSPAGGEAAAERRQLTVLFCDLVGSTALAERLDPEELHPILRRYHEICARVIQRFEGHIHQYLGDGVLAYFGYPQAHEDDGRRSVQTGLGIVEAIADLNRRLDQDAGVRLAVRVGIHTGLVVVGETGSGELRETLAVGETPNIAARVQELAEPDTVVVSAATYHLIQSHFDCRGLGVYSLKGISRPLALYRVLQEGNARRRSAGLAPLVGRDRELELLWARWDAARAGSGSVVLLRGEAGVGKSHLVRALQQRVARESKAWLPEYRCSPYHRNSAFYPVIDLLKRVVLRFRRDDADPVRLGKLEEWVLQSGLPVRETVSLFAALLAVSLNENYPPLPITPERQRLQTMEALLRVLLEQSVRQPVLAVAEDLHWADPSTLELLGWLIERTPVHRILVVLTCRPEFAAPWTVGSQITEIGLERLSPASVERLIHHVSGGKPLPPEVLKELVDKTDGVPLFVEELTKTVLESALLHDCGDRYELAGPLRPLAIPATLDDSLMARLDRLAPVKAVAQLGATLGREFSYEMLQVVSPLDEATLQDALAQLVAAELISRKGVPPKATYVFRHALIQEKAYQSLLKSVRRRYHRQIAQVLAERMPELVETQPELLAHHYTEAGLGEQAVPLWQKAGQAAFRRSANIEAIADFRQGLELLDALPDTAERCRQELMLRVMLGPALVNAKGFAAAEVGEVYGRARTLCRQFGETPQLFPALWGLCGFYLLRGELHTGRELAEEMVRLAERTTDPVLQMHAHYGLGCALYFLGELEGARDHLEQAIGLYDPERHHAHAIRYGQDPGVAAQTYLAATLWYLGYPDRALATIEKALALARRLKHPYTLGQALVFATMIRFWRGEVAATRALAEETIAFCTEQVFPIWVALGLLHRGAALVLEGRPDEGIEQMHRGYAAWQASRSELVQAYFLNALAGGYEKTGRAEEGLAFVEEALARAQRHGEARAEAEAYRIKGDLLAALPAPDLVAAEQCLKKAIDCSRRMGARSRELQAVLSLCRLWDSQGRLEEVRQRLEEILKRFSEGFDTADLRAAATLLGQLSGE